MPFLRKVPSGKATLRALMVGEVRRPQAKNSRKMTMVAWITLGLP